MGILRMGKQGSRGFGIQVPIEEAGAFQIRRPCFPSHRPDAFIRAVSSDRPSSAECPLRVRGFVCRGSYWGLSEGKNNGDIVCRAKEENQTWVEDLFFLHEADRGEGGSSEVHGLWR